MWANVNIYNNRINLDAQAKSVIICYYPMQKNKDGFAVRKRVHEINEYKCNTK